MRLRTLLTTAVVSTLIAGGAGGAHATRPASADRAGSVVAWSDPGDTDAVAAGATPADLTAPVAALAATSRSTAAVTADGGLRVWGNPTADEVAAAPAGVTDAVAVALNMQAGLVLHRDGSVTGWGRPELEEVPAGLKAKAVTVSIGGTAYAVKTDGTVVSWGVPADFPMPGGLTDIVDVAAGALHVTALRADGSVAVWRQHNPDPGTEAFFAQLDAPDFGAHKVTAVDASSMASGAVLDDGSIRVWGIAVPPDQPADFGGAKVVSLDVSDNNTGVVLDDGAVRTWGSNAGINNNRPASLTGKPVASIAVGGAHAAVIVTTFRAIAKPTVAGTPQVGQTLTATPATFSLTPDAAATGQWYSGSDPIAGQTGTTLKLTDAMLGKKVGYRSTAKRGAETVTSASDEVGPVTAIPPAKVASTTTLAVAPATGEFGSARTATATVAKTGGTPTGTVTFKVGAAEATATLANGVATLALPKTLAVGTHSVTATYSGDATTNASASAAVPVTVVKAASTVATGKAKVKGKSKRVAKKVKLTITVDTADGISPAGKVTVTLKGKTKKKVTASVDADGKAKVTFKKVKRGKYQAKLAYAGNANVAAATATAKLKV